MAYKVCCGKFNYICTYNEQACFFLYPRTKIIVFGRKIARAFLMIICHQQQQQRFVESLIRWFCSNIFSLILNDYRGFAVDCCNLCTSFEAKIVFVAWPRIWLMVVQNNGMRERILQSGISKRSKWPQNCTQNCTKFNGKQTRNCKHQQQQQEQQWFLWSNPKWHLFLRVCVVWHFLTGLKA